MSQVKQYINSEWRSVLIGKQGPQGLKGDKGDKGDTGEQGPAGSVNDNAIETTSTWSSYKLNQVLGDISSALAAILGV